MLEDFLTCKHTNVQSFTDYCLNCGYNIWTTKNEYLKKKHNNKVPVVSSYQIPFDKNGNQLHYPEGDYTMQDNYQFMDKIKFSHFSRGRSAAYAIFKRSTGESLVVFLSDLHEMMPRLQYGTIDSAFRFIKKGQNYGIQMVK